MAKVKITSFDALDREVARLKRRSRDLEQELSGRVDYFKDNYKKMALNSVIPGTTRHKGMLNIAKHVASIAWSSGKFKPFVTSALMTALEFIGVRLGIDLFNKYQRYKKKRRRRKPEENGQPAAHQ